MSAMFNAKPLASLSSQLLARKGQAKPAMRSQGYGGFASMNAASVDDLGWNDMGTPTPATPEAPTPVAGPVLVAPVFAPEPEAVEPVHVSVPVPPVVALQEALTEKIEAAEVRSAPTPAPVEQPAEPVVRPVSLATAARISRDSAKQTKGGKSAFTLRLDAERHLRLRLASALANRSAQMIVAEALDAWLAATPDVDALITQLPQPKTR